MDRKHYPNDLKDKEWLLLREILEEFNISHKKQPGGRPSINNKRDYFDAIFYVLRIGCSWRNLPHDFPKWQSVYTQLRRWKEQGLVEFLHEKLNKKLRALKGKLEPFISIVDSQSVKTTDKGGPNGYDGAKKINGRKRHILVDS